MKLGRLSEFAGAYTTENSLQNNTIKIYSSNQLCYQIC